LGYLITQIEDAVSPKILTPLTPPLYDIRRRVEWIINTAPRIIAKPNVELATLKIFLAASAVCVCGDNIIRTALFAMNRSCGKFKKKKRRKGTTK
jgi:hypothetical protein